MKYLVFSLVTLCSLMGVPETGSQQTVEAASPYQYRQYYSNWSYQPQRRYYARRLYYKPTPTYSGYSYHYAIHYPKRYSPQPRYSRYVYYYNPVRKVYWGRFDLQGKPGEQYSLLKEADRKTNLDDIPEKAFPKPGLMPVIPESTDGVRIEPIKLKDLPDESELDDLPAGLPKS